MIKQTWTSTNHEYGACLVNESEKLIYIHIPKCASTWMKTYLSMLTGWRHANITEFDLAKYTLLIILRDPEDRWFSQSPGHTRILENNFVSHLPKTFNNFNQWLSDEHSTPQTDFLVGIDLTNAIYFKCDKNLSKTVELYFNSSDIIELPEFKNTQPNTEHFKQAKLVWKELFKNERYFKIFKNAYKKDYDLINSIKFYGHN